MDSLDLRLKVKLQTFPYSYDMTQGADRFQTGPRSREVLVLMSHKQACLAILSLTTQKCPELRSHKSALRPTVSEMTTSYFQRKKSAHYSFDLFFSKITKSYEKVSLFFICDLNRQNFSFAVDISVIY